MSSDLLHGSRILLVEDFAPLSAFLEGKLHDAGAEVVGPAATLSKARELAHENGELAAALLDVRLHGGEEVWPVARILASNNVPFVFYTAHLDSTTLPAEWMDRPIITKPSSVPNIVRALAEVVVARQNAHNGRGRKAVAGHRL